MIEIGGVVGWLVGWLGATILARPGTFPPDLPVVSTNSSVDFLNFKI